jgi:16S rRNA (cytosine1402-N4)-methyltransferase
MEHFPVMLNESMAYLAPRPDGVYADLTCGLGNHTLAIANRLTTGKIVALDRDGDSLEKARSRAAESPELCKKIIFRRAAFSSLPSVLDEMGIGRLNGVLADLGVSRLQLTSPERGFSLREGGPLDMRMDRSQELTAADLVNRASERDLAQLFEQTGEERRDTAEKIARAIVRGRPVKDTSALAGIVESVVPRHGKLHPATRVFMALRIAVNEELEELDALLERAPECLASGGRWVMIAFHSLEDRRVKQAFKALAKSGRARVLTKHVVKAGDEEVRINAASRSAVLRAVEMV